MNIENYVYMLPAELIAQKPAVKRDGSRLMVINCDSDSIVHRNFSDLPEFFEKDDLIVVNDTEVFPARLIGKKESSGGEVELFLLYSHNDGTWEALSRPARRARDGTVIIFGDGLIRAEIIEKSTNSSVRVCLESTLPIEDAINKIGRTPLPPYIKREPVESDRERYQTVYAKKRGSVAAPTAGLHFTPAILDTLASRGISIASVTLHIGIGTFKPLSSEEARGTALHSEYCNVPNSTVQMVKACHSKGGRVFAVGTTSARALETASARGELAPFEGRTDIFIKPPYTFKSVDVLLTNFHLPRSSLLLLVCAFAGKEKIMNAYNEAVKKRYRFYSYGDAMLIIRSKHS